MPIYTFENGGRTIEQIAPMGTDSIVIEGKRWQRQPIARFAATGFARESELKDKVKQEPAVKKVMEAFPDATITDVRPKVSGAVAPDPSPETAITASVDEDGLPTLKADTTDFITAESLLSRVVKTAEGTDVLRRLWQANIGVIERMEREAPKLHEKVKKAFNDRRTALKKG